MKRVVGRNITKADLQAAQRLKAAWLAMPNRPTQQQLADAWGDEANQSLISQYLNGRIALNYRAVLFFAHALGCNPAAIRNDLPEQKGPAPVALPVQSQPMRITAGMVTRAVRYIERRFIGAQEPRPVHPMEDADLIAYALNEELDEAAGIAASSNLIDFEKALAKRLAQKAESSVKKGTG